MSAATSDRAPYNDRREKKHNKPTGSPRISFKSTQMTLRDAAFLLAGYMSGYAAAAEEEKR